jgi:hypothetical protein
LVLFPSFGSLLLHPLNLDGDQPDYTFDFCVESAELSEHHREPAVEFIPSRFEERCHARILLEPILVPVHGRRDRLEIRLGKLVGSGKICAPAQFLRLGRVLRAVTMAIDVCAMYVGELRQLSK